MAIKDGLYILFGCITMYICNIYGNLFIRQQKYFDTSLSLIIDTYYLSPIVQASPQCVAISVILYLIFLWLFSHLLSIVISGFKLDNQSSWSNKNPRHNNILHVSGSVQSRLYSSHLNAAEQLIFIGISITLCFIFNVDNNVINRYCFGIAVFRTLFHICYAMDLDILRSLFFELALGNMFLLLFNACFGSNVFEPFLDQLTQRLFINLVG